MDILTAFADPNLLFRSRFQINLFDLDLPAQRILFQPGKIRIFNQELSLHLIRMIFLEECCNLSFESTHLPFEIRGVINHPQMSVSDPAALPGGEEGSPGDRAS